ncbi:MAG: hypothetical protein WA761_02375 [Thermoplasmata archaeon]|jgi:hypothetical protein
MANETEQLSKGMIEGWIEAIRDKHGQLDIRFQNLSLSVGGGRMGVTMTGGITVSVHMRELSDSEKDAHVNSQLANLRP